VAAASYLRMHRVHEHTALGLAEHEAEVVLENWLAHLPFMVRETERGVRTYTMHPQVIGRGHRMLMLERLIDSLEEMGARFCRMDEALEEFLR